MCTRNSRGSWTARQNCAGDRSWFGIGQAIALSLAGEGARFGNGCAPGNRGRHRCGGDGLWVEALGLPLDVTNYGRAQAVVQQAVQRFGRVDILVNCAGPGGSICLWILSLKTGPLK